MHLCFSAFSWQKMASTADRFFVIEDIRNNITFICVALLCINLCTKMIITLLDPKNKKTVHSCICLGCISIKYVVACTVHVYFYFLRLFDARGINTSLFHCCNNIIFCNILYTFSYFSIILIIVIFKVVLTGHKYFIISLL
jgi:hypothetical protein